MDPLSISSALASFLTLSGACAKRLRQIIHDANHAPDEILALSNEVSDLNILFSDLQAVSDLIAIPSHSQPGGHSSDLINGQIVRAKRNLLLLETSSADLFSTLPDGKLKFQRVAWVRKKARLCALQQDFVDIKRNIALLLAATTASRGARLEVSLQSMQLASPAMSDLNVPVVAIDQQRISHEQVNVPKEHVRGTPEKGTSPSLSQASTDAGSSFDTIAADWKEDGTMSTFLQTVKQVAQFGSMTFHVNRLARCNGDCKCACHTRRIIQSPSFLNRVLGQLFIGYAGLPVLSSDCNVVNCTNQYRRQMQVSYTFPGWLLLKTVDIVAAMTQNNEPSFGLKVRNRVRGDTTTENSLFTYSRNGNLAGIIDLFKQRKASPNDISAGGGLTPLHFALELGHIETCQFFLSIGIDPYAKQDSGFSDAHEVSSLILANPRGTRAWDYEGVFSKIACEHAELWDFTFVHSVVVGILHVDLESVLLRPECQADIDRCDSYGRTPIFWAALRGDSHAIKLLLHAGASISSQDLELRTPLQAAIQSTDIRSVELLLIAGASVHTRDSHGDAAIQIAAWADDNEAMIELIYLAGASLDAKNNASVTALQSAACLNHHRVGRYLLKVGANIETRDKDNDSCLFEAVRYGNVAMAEVLLDHGARVDYMNNSGMTILHIAAIWGNADTMGLLARARLRGVDPETRDCKKRTAREAFEARFDLEPGLQNAFNQLLSSITPVIRVNEIDEDEDDEDIDFVDALEGPEEEASALNQIQA